MELSNLNGNIIGVVSNDYKRIEYENMKVSDIVLNKKEAALKMVGFLSDITNTYFSDLSIGNQNRVILASKLQDKCIILINFSIGLTKKDMEFFKKLFKKLTLYDKKIILVDSNSEIFFNLVDNIYVINKEIIYSTSNIFDKNLSKYMDLPKIVEFTQKCENKGIKINHYNEKDELLKAIYRIKS